jgi:hypothetical protein
MKRENYFKKGESIIHNAIQKSLEFLSNMFNFLADNIIEVATFITAAAALINVIELRRSRVAADKPELIIEGTEYSLDWKSDKSGGKRLIEILQLSERKSLTIVNVGKGIAKSAEIEFEFDKKLIDKINYGLDGNNSEFFIEKSGVDKKGNLYYFTVNSCYFEQGDIPYSYYPYPENQFDPMFHHKRNSYNFRTDEEYKIEIPDYFKILCEVYGICLANSVIDDYSYQPKLPFKISYKDVYNKKIKSEFLLACKINDDRNDDNESEKIHFIYEVSQIK